MLKLLRRNTPLSLLSCSLLLLCACSSQTPKLPLNKPPTSQNVSEQKIIPHPRMPEKKIYHEELKVYHLDEWDPAKMNEELKAPKPQAAPATPSATPSNTKTVPLPKKQQ